MSKPTVLPRWVTDGNAADEDFVVEPTSGKKDVGWVKRERPPAQTLNWILHYFWKWIEWIASKGPRQVSWADWLAEPSTDAAPGAVGPVFGMLLGSGDEAYYPFDLAENDIIRTITIDAYVTSGKTLTVTLKKQDRSDGTVSTVGSPFTTPASTGEMRQAQATDVDEQVESGFSYWLDCTSDGDSVVIVGGELDID